MSTTTLPTAGRGVTPAMLARWAREHRIWAQKVLTAQEFARSERERVDAYILPIFQAHGFQGEIGMGGHLITSPDKLYLCEDEARCLAYFRECDQAHRAHGFTGPEGDCPALSADWDRIQAEGRLLDAAGQLLGFTSAALHGATRKRMLQLLLEVCTGESKR